jgi:hypothetical protein
MLPPVQNWHRFCYIPLLQLTPPLLDCLFCYPLPTDERGSGQRVNFLYNFISMDIIKLNVLSGLARLWRVLPKGCDLTQQKKLLRHPGIMASEYTETSGIR